MPLVIYNLNKFCNACIDVVVMFLQELSIQCAIKETHIEQLSHTSIGRILLSAFIL